MVYKLFASRPPPRGYSGSRRYIKPSQIFLSEHSVLLLLDLHLFRKLGLGLLLKPLSHLGVVGVHEPSLGLGLEGHGSSFRFKGARRRYKASGESGRV